MATASKIKIEAARTGNPTGMQGVHLYEGPDTDLNNASVVASAYIDPSTITTDFFGAEYTLSFSSPYVVDVSKYYFIVFDDGLTIDGSNKVYFAGYVLSGGYWVDTAPVDGTWSWTSASFYTGGQVLNDAEELILDGPPSLGNPKVNGLVPGNSAFASEPYQPDPSPEKPTVPFPVDAADKVVNHTAMTLTWVDDGYGEANEAATYDLYFGTDVGGPVYKAVSDGAYV
ncbi:hypothetical protein KA005_33860, partial [bacterium]|nr:hypothetical protein [bacterium]